MWRSAPPVNDTNVAAKRVEFTSQRESTDCADSIAKNWFWLDTVINTGATKPFGNKPEQKLDLW